ncbi:protein NO VEIN domain-containing protein [Lysinibacillus irui]|uniref:protein NO VEIN domain-containing protein n=1 Tax=Lysinibacillus irui TaxID=2998077 RepID=UPI004043FFF5
MSFSVGILYSAQSFLELVKDNEISGDDFPNLFKKFVVADSKYILETALECKWVTVQHNNQLKVTKRGEEILFYHESFQRLRVQIAHLIETYRPSWAPLICYGRKEAIKYFSNEVKQCFSEAYLLEGYNREVIEWWDKLAVITKGMNEDVRLELGRRGELLSVEYEHERTGILPVWQSIDSNLSGYDLLSQMSECNNIPLRIEVKTTNSMTNISITITKGEWDVAEKSTEYVFHIWSVFPHKELYVLTKEDMKKHIPINQGNGRWQEVEVIFTREELVKYKKRNDG